MTDFGSYDSQLRQAMRVDGSSTIGVDFGAAERERKRKQMEEEERAEAEKKAKFDYDLSNAFLTDKGAEFGTKDFASRQKMLERGIALQEELDKAARAEAGKSTQFDLGKPGSAQKMDQMMDRIMGSDKGATRGAPLKGETPGIPSLDTKLELQRILEQIGEVPAYPADTMVPGAPAGKPRAATGRDLPTLLDEHMRAGPKAIQDRNEVLKRLPAVERLKVLQILNGETLPDNSPLKQQIRQERERAMKLQQVQAMAQTVKDRFGNMEIPNARDDSQSNMGSMGGAAAVAVNPFTPEPQKAVAYQTLGRMAPVPLPMFAENMLYGDPQEMA